MEYPVECAKRVVVMERPSVFRDAVYLNVSTGEYRYTLLFNYEIRLAALRLVHKCEQSSVAVPTYNTHASVVDCKTGVIAWRY